MKIERLKIKMHDKQVQAKIEPRDEVKFRQNVFSAKSVLVPREIINYVAKKKVQIRDEKKCRQTCFPRKRFCFVKKLILWQKKIL